MCLNNHKCKCHCKEDIDAHNICADNIDTHCLEAQKANICDLCATSIAVKNLSAENEIANNLCISGRITANEAWSGNSVVNNLCATNLNATNGCIANLRVGALDNCAKWRAAVTINAPFVYNLGNTIDWNVVLDDPNGNVAVAPFSYTVPVSGYYSLNFYLNSNNLAGAGVISGTPVGLLTILSNGNILRQAYAPFLSFSNTQFSSLSALVLLNAGDVVRMRYDILVLDTVLGLISYAGTVNINGNGLFPASSGFEIHYLSSLNCSPAVCLTCPNVTIPCESVITPCDPCEVVANPLRVRSNDKLAHDSANPCGCSRTV